VRHLSRAQAITTHDLQDAAVRQIRRRFGLSVAEFIKAVDAGRLNRSKLVVHNCLDNLKRAGLA
jgi:DNA-binding transcriptional regulator YiaG